MKQWHATLSCLSSTAWGKVFLFVGCRLTDQKKHHSLICRTILFATPPQERSHWCKPQRPLSCLAAQPWRIPDARSMDKPYSSFTGISLKAVPFLYAISIFQDVCKTKLYPFIRNGYAIIVQSKNFHEVSIFICRSDFLSSTRSFLLASTVIVQVQRYGSGLWK